MQRQSGGQDGGGLKLSSRNFQICLALFVLLWITVDWAWSRQHTNPNTGIDTHFPAGGLASSAGSPSSVDNNLDDDDLDGLLSSPFGDDTGERPTAREREELIAELAERERLRKLERAQRREEERLALQEQKRLLEKRSDSAVELKELEVQVEALEKEAAQEAQEAQRRVGENEVRGSEERRRSKDRRRRQRLEADEEEESQRRRKLEEKEAVEEATEEEIKRRLQREQERAGSPLVEKEVEKRPAPRDRTVRPKETLPVLQSPTTCGHWNGRDYRQDPIWSNLRSESPGVLANCDIPCVWSPGKPANARYLDISSSRSCSHMQRFEQSMEAIYRGREWNRDGVIQSYPDLNSDVPAPYFSWAEYGFMEKLEPKTATAMAAAFISNCGSHARLEYLSALMKAGVTVDSFGSCLNNKKSMASGKGNWFKAKINELKKYKFAIAFENTMLTDYVTEKLFMSFIAGAVPIHMGIADVHKFGPSNRSIISTHDFKSPEKLAELLIYLDKNDAEYEKYLDWKWKGYSSEFQAMIDLSEKHSACRACVEAADRIREAVGDPHPSVRPYPEDNWSDVHYADEFFVKIRPRGDFWFKRLWLPFGVDAKSLHALVSKHFDIQPPRELFMIQTRKHPHILLNTTALVRRHVLEGAELEAIIITRPDFTYLQEWYPERYRP